MTLVSIVLPTYNERQTISSILHDLLRVARCEGLEVELIVVDDNSPDGTAAEVRAAFAHESAVVRVHTRAGRGLAGAVRCGTELAKGDVIVVMDADGNHRPEAVPGLVQALPGADLVVGSRYVPGGGMPGSHLRYTGSRAFSLCARTILRLPVADCLSGFLCFRRTLLKEMDRDAIFVGYGDYAIRLLYWAARRGWKILEIPTSYGLRRGGVSKTSLPWIFRHYSSTVLRLRFSGLALSMPRGRDAGSA